MTDLPLSARDQLRSFVHRIERLEEEIGALNSDKAEVYKEAKGDGFDVKVLRSVIRIRRNDPDKQAEHDAALATYLHALDETGTHVATRARTTRPDEFQHAAHPIERRETGRVPVPPSNSVPQREDRVPVINSIPSRADLSQGETGRPARQQSGDAVPVARDGCHPSIVRPIDAAPSTNSEIDLELPAYLDRRKACPA